ncbi:hypothetical protein D3C71_1835370 [compost metagenome]
MMGVILGLLSHLFLDAINPQGIHLYPGFKIRLVPRTAFFATGGPWETIIYYLSLVISVGAALNLALSYFKIDLYTAIGKLVVWSWFVVIYAWDMALKYV